MARRVQHVRQLGHRPKLPDRRRLRMSGGSATSTSRLAARTSTPLRSMAASDFAVVASEPVPMALDLERLGLTQLRADLSELAGRPVNFMIYRSVEDALERSPSILVP